MRPLNHTRAARLLLLCLDQDLTDLAGVDRWAEAALQHAEAPRWLIDIRHACTKNRRAVQDALQHHAEPVASLETALAFLALLYTKFKGGAIDIHRCNAILHSATSRVQIPGEFRYLSGAMSQACRAQQDGFLSEQRAVDLASDLFERYSGFSRLIPDFWSECQEATRAPRTAVA